jgi:hypothetical protein
MEELAIDILPLSSAKPAGFSASRGEEEERCDEEELETVGR